MGAIASQITSLTIVYSTAYSGADQIKHQSSALLAFVWGIHRWPVNSPHKCPVPRKMFPFEDVIMGRSQVLCAYFMDITVRMGVIIHAATRMLLDLSRHQDKISLPMPNRLNSLTPGRKRCILKNTVFNLVLSAGAVILSYGDDVFGLMPLDLTGGKSTLLQIMAWCPQATSNYRS